jgi:hypothetical protein
VCHRSVRSTCTPRQVASNGRRTRVRRCSLFAPLQCGEICAHDRTVKA